MAQFACTIETKTNLFYRSYNCYFSGTAYNQAPLCADRLRVVPWLD